MAFSLCSQSLCQDKLTRDVKTSWIPSKLKCICLKTSMYPFKNKLPWSQGMCASQVLKEDVSICCSFSKKKKPTTLKSSKISTHLWMCDTFKATLQFIIGSTDHLTKVFSGYLHLLHSASPSTQEVAAQPPNTPTPTSPIPQPICFQWTAVAPLLCLSIIVGTACFLQLLAQVVFFQFSWVADHELLGKVLQRWNEIMK